MPRIPLPSKISPKPLFFILLSLTAAFLSPGCQTVTSKAPPPKNIIIMIADGCGFEHVAAARMYQYGPAGSAVYENFPVRYAVTTFPHGGSYDPARARQDFDYVQKNPTDSAAAATTLATGSKTLNGRIGIDPDGRQLTNLVQRCQQLGKATGVVTSVPFSHATPAAFVAHNPSRDNYQQIALEMIYDSHLEVIMGCGHPLFDNHGQPLPQPQSFDFVGGQNTWLDLHAGTADSDDPAGPWNFIQSRREFHNLAQGPTPARVCGLAPVAQTLQQARDGDPHADAFAVEFITTVPTLTEMTAAALNVLDEDPDGLFLMIEGGAVDWASHANQSGRTIEEQIDFNHAVEAVVAWVDQNSNWNDTLLIVTADHETGHLTVPNSASDPDAPQSPPHTMPTMQWHSKSHTNQLVPFYARGQAAPHFQKSADTSDPRRGLCLDNTDIPNTLFHLLN